MEFYRRTIHSVTIVLNIRFEPHVTYFHFPSSTDMALDHIWTPNHCFGLERQLRGAKPVSNGFVDAFQRRIKP